MRRLGENVLVALVVLSHHAAIGGTQYRGSVVVVDVAAVVVIDIGIVVVVVADFYHIWSAELMCSSVYWQSGSSPLQLEHASCLCLYLLALLV